MLQYPEKGQYQYKLITIHNIDGKINNDIDLTISPAILNNLHKE